MILNQNIVLHSEAKPYFSKIHRLNSVEDFDDVVDWTAEQNDQKRKMTESDIVSAQVRERCVSSESTSNTEEATSELPKRSEEATSTVIDKSSTYMSDDSAKVHSSFMPSLPSCDRKNKKRSRGVEEPREVVDENADSTEEFGEGIKNLFQKVKNRMKGKTCKNCVSKLEEEIPLRVDDLEDDYRNKIKYIIPFRRSAPMCLLNERCSGDNYQASPGVSFVQPGFDNIAACVDSKNKDEAALYEVRWLEHSPMSPSTLRHRREVERFQQQTFSIMQDKLCGQNEKATNNQQELMNMIRAVKTEFLQRNNLTFLPVLFVPHCGTKTCPGLPDTPELGQITFQTVEPQESSMPSHGKLANFSNIEIGHMTIILLSNNTLSLVIPAPKPQSQTTELPTLPLPCFSEKNIPFKRNVIDNLRQYLQNAFNFIDIRRVLTEDELHDRNTREISNEFNSNVVPGILIYPSRYGPTMSKSSRQVPEYSCCNNAAHGNPTGYYYFTTNSRGSTKNKRNNEEYENTSNCYYPCATSESNDKVKRSLEEKRTPGSETDIASEETELEIERKQVQLEKEMEKELDLDKVITYI
ncbi:hypothetical protein HHI36_023986 [Cryptolaemus montrouzieri]|uniref:Uncharacterized protein n=1 Tax=Cryptolaemus montrouzieri TaxID=559131 RepID=A0ABD2NQJ2_9CUCU